MLDKFDKAGRKYFTAAQKQARAVMKPKGFQDELRELGKEFVRGLRKGFNPDMRGGKFDG